MEKKRIRSQEQRPIDSCRASVNDAEQWILLRCVEVCGLDQNAFDSCSVLTLPRNHFTRAERERLCLIVKVRQFTWSKTADVSHEHFAHAGRGPAGEAD